MRRGSMFWGLVIILAGIVLLLRSLGILPDAFGAYFWPGALILLGLWFLFSPRIGGRIAGQESASFPLENASQALVDLRHGAGRLHVNALSEPFQLAAGTFAGGVDHNLRRDGTRAALSLSTPAGIFSTPPFGVSQGLEWNLGLTREIPLELELHTGASETDLDLSDLKVTRLLIETGASATRVTLPANAGFTQVQTKSGMASMDLRVPDGVAAHIHISGGMSDIRVSSARFPQADGAYETPGYSSAANRVEILVEAGMGSVEIH